MSTPVSVATSNSNPVKSVKKTGSRRKDNIRKRGNSWQARVVLNGKSETRTFRSHDAALLWLDLKRGAQLDGDLGQFHKAQHLTLRTAILQYRDHLIKAQGEDCLRQG